MKKSFALLTTMILVVLFSYTSIAMVETSLISSNLNKLKYLHLQAKIYSDKIRQYIHTHNNVEIADFVNQWNDNRFFVTIVNDEINSSIYYVSIKTTDESHIRLSQTIIK